jgi:hypothetical protein
MFVTRNEVEPTLALDISLFTNSLVDHQGGDDSVLREDSNVRTGEERNLENPPPMGSFSSYLTISSIQSSRPTEEIRPENATKANWPYFMVNYLLRGLIPELLPDIFKRLMVKQKNFFQLVRGVLYRKVMVDKIASAVPYIVPEGRHAKLSEIHQVFQHLSTPSVLKSLKVRVWWPLIERDYADFVKSCHACQLTREKGSAIPIMHPLSAPGIPFFRWGLDFVQDLPANKEGFTQIITCIDYSTRFLVAKPVKRRDAKTVADFLFQEILLKFGAPNEIITDRASCFMANVLQDYLDSQRIHHYPSTPFHPQTNGMVERVHAVLGDMLTKMTDGMRDRWYLFVPSAVFALNARTHTVTGYSPFRLVYGFSPALPGDIDPPFIFDTRDAEEQIRYTVKELQQMGHARAAALFRTQKQSEKMKMLHDQENGATTDVYQVGEFVKVRNNSRLKFESRWNGPFIVDRIGPNHCYYLKARDGLELKNPVNHMHLAPYVSQADLSGTNDAPRERGGTVAPQSNTH